MYSKELGWIPQTREQRIGTLFQSAQANGFTSDYTEFKGSNIHRIHSSTTIPALETMDDNIVQALTNIFAYMEMSYKDIAKGSYGSSYEGWANSFRNLCTGLYIVDSTIDPSLGTAGNIALYFDDLLLDDARVQQAFLRCVWAGMITHHKAEATADKHDISLEFTASDAKTYLYHNLTPDNYTHLYLRVFTSYKRGMLTYSPTVIDASIREQFDAINRIGRGFYADSYFDHDRLPNLAGLRILSSLDDINWLEGDRPAEPWQKYIIDTIEVRDE